MIELFFSALERILWNSAKCGGVLDKENFSCYNVRAITGAAKGDVAKSMAGGIALQGALIGLDGIAGKLSTSVLESQLLDGAMQYGAKQMALTGAIRIGANIWRNKDKILNAFFKE